MINFKDTSLETLEKNLAILWNSLSVYFLISLTCSPAQPSLSKTIYKLAILSRKIAAITIRVWGKPLYNGWM